MFYLVSWFKMCRIQLHEHANYDLFYSFSTIYLRIHWDRGRANSHFKILNMFGQVCAHFIVSFILVLFTYFAIVFLLLYLNYFTLIISYKNLYCARGMYYSIYIWKASHVNACQIIYRIAYLCWLWGATYSLKIKNTTTKNKTKNNQRKTFCSK